MSDQSTYEKRLEELEKAVAELQVHFQEAYENVVQANGTAQAYHKVVLALICSHLNPAFLEKEMRAALASLEPNSASASGPEAHLKGVQAADKVLVAALQRARKRFEE